MEIPRCRATVSEEIYSRSLEETPGRPAVGTGRRALKHVQEGVHPYSQSQETGANRQHQPLSRVKGGVHAVLSIIRLLIFFLDGIRG